MSKYILKLARCIQELERIKGVRQGSTGGNGSNQYSCFNDKLSPKQNPQITQEDIAKQFGVSVKKVVLLIETTKCPLYKIKTTKCRLDTPQITQEGRPKTRTNCRSLILTNKCKSPTTICRSGK